MLTAVHRALDPINVGEDADGEQTVVVEVNL